MKLKTQKTLLKCLDRLLLFFHDTLIINTFAGALWKALCVRLSADYAMYYKQLKAHYYDLRLINISA